jgi:lantibiotic biosynthesis protein
MASLRRARSTASRPRARATRGYGDPGGTYLDVAAAIGREICREAYWHAGWCSWLGATARAPDSPVQQSVSARSLGPEPYGGTGGIALFLAELADATGDDAARRTAFGSIRHALGRAREIAPPVHLGLYTGRPGLALFAHRVGMLLEAEDVVAGARALLDDLDVDLAAPHEHDLLSGAAGAIVALLRLADVLDNPSLIDRAIRLGERLAESAHRDERGCSWPSLATWESPNLTGLSHGAAGIGLALLDLWRASQDERFHRLAGEAFAFERSWFNRDEANWPDFREVDDLAARADGPLPTATHWCHGAPGIALSRLRAWELTGDTRYRDEAVTALETTRRAVVAALTDGTGNYSLCHGLAGNAEILILGGSLLGSGFERLSETGHAVARAGIDLYARHDRSWPCGTRGGWTPNLMLGLAGIGHFYLRLARPALPSVLLFPTLS